MDMRAFLLAALAALVALMLVGTVWYLPTASLYGGWETGLARESTMNLLEIIYMVVQALVLAYLLPLLHSSGGLVRDGIRTGLILGVFAISFPITIYASWNVSGAEMVAESIFGVVSLAIAGAAAGWVYGRLATSSAPADAERTAAPSA